MNRSKHVGKNGGPNLASVELGTFAVFAIFPFISLIFMKGLRSWGWPGMIIAGGVGLLGFIMLSAMALFMFSEYDVVQTKVYDSYASNDLTYNGNGTLIENSTITTPERTEQTPVIDSFQLDFGYLFSVLALVYGLICFKVIATG